MTGFGKSEGTFKGKKYFAEIRSVNSRYSEISLRYPRQFASYDLELKEIVRKRISRGKISVNFSEESGSVSAAGMNLNLDLIKSYAAELNKINKEIGSSENVKLEHILTMTNLFGQDLSEEAGEEERKFLFRLLDNALDDLIKMKKREGESLKKDITERINFIKSESDVISKISSKKTSILRKKLKEKINSILKDKRIIDENRLETEIVLYADRIDITEELIRLKSHNKYFIENMKSNELSGRRLNFLVQEINREINTIASKSMDAEISQKSVVLKEELEKIREQLQNVE